MFHHFRLIIPQDPFIWGIRSIQIFSTKKSLKKSSGSPQVFLFKWKNSRNRQEHFGFPCSHRSIFGLWCFGYESQCTLSWDPEVNKRRLSPIWIRKMGGESVVGPWGLRCSVVSKFTRGFWHWELMCLKNLWCYFLPETVLILVLVVSSTRSLRREKLIPQWSYRTLHCLGLALFFHGDFVWCCFLYKNTHRLYMIARW